MDLVVLLNCRPRVVRDVFEHEPRPCLGAFRLPALIGPLFGGALSKLRIGNWLPCSVTWMAMPKGFVGEFSPLV